MQNGTNSSLNVALAPISQPIQSSPQEQPEPIEEPIDEFEQLDNEPAIEPPRLSLPIQESEEEGDETSPEMRPPRMSLAFGEEDMDITYQSVEYPRRETSIRDRERLSILSRATGRISGDFEETRLESDDAEETGIIGEDEEEDTMFSGGDFDRGWVYKCWTVYVTKLISQIGERLKTSGDSTSTLTFHLLPPLRLMNPSMGVTIWKISRCLLRMSKRPLFHQTMMTTLAATSVSD